MRKIVGINPTGINKRFATAILILLSIFIIISFFASCGNDTVTNNNNNNPPNETLIYFQDSLSLITPPFTKDTTVAFRNVNNIKITFTAETNADSINGWSLFNITAIDSTLNSVIMDTSYNKTLHMNQSFNFAITGITNTVFVGLTIQCVRNPPHIFFMKLKNIKIYKIN